MDLIQHSRWVKVERKEYKSGTSVSVPRVAGWTLISALGKSNNSGCESRSALLLKNQACKYPARTLYDSLMATPKKTTRKPSAAFMKPVTPDDKLAAVVGATPLPRTELTKKLWVYIKKNKLQDAKKKTMINADDALKAVFNGKKTVSMFEMTKLVSGHLKK